MCACTRNGWSKKNNPMVRTMTPLKSAYRFNIPWKKLKFKIMFFGGVMTDWRKIIWRLGHGCVTETQHAPQTNLRPQFWSLWQIGSKRECCECETIDGHKLTVIWGAPMGQAVFRESAERQFYWWKLDIAGHFYKMRGANKLSNFLHLPLVPALVTFILNSFSSLALDELPCSTKWFSCIRFGG